MDATWSPDSVGILGPSGSVLAVVAVIVLLRLTILGLRSPLANRLEQDLEAAKAVSQDTNSWRETILFGVFSMSRWPSPRSLFAKAAGIEDLWAPFQDPEKQKPSFGRSRREPDMNDIRKASESFSDLRDWADNDDGIEDALFDWVNGDDDDMSLSETPLA
mmetsp:Transcript_8628/g.14009  ORF Transcript_8628/g.14009 Transcript_8628/m.14009 type:complete len:161 (-) Transcript_8628:86-568(-)